MFTEAPRSHFRVRQIRGAYYSEKLDRLTSKKIERTESSAKGKECLFQPDCLKKSETFFLVISSGSERTFEAGHFD